jgi:hypothetical protein
MCGQQSVCLGYRLFLFFVLFDIVLLRIILTTLFSILIVFHLDIFVIINTYFFAKPEKTAYGVLEGEEIAIRIMTSVPVECIGSSAVIRQTCTQTIKIAQPVYQGNPSDKCTNNIQEEAMVFNTQECGVTFSTNNWEMPVNLIVTGYIDNVYNTDDRTGHNRLKIEEGSSTGVSGVWDTVNIPDIQVRIDSCFLNPNRKQFEQNFKRISQAQGKTTSHITTKWLVCSPQIEMYI